MLSIKHLKISWKNGCLYVNNFNLRTNEKGVIFAPSGTGKSSFLSVIRKLNLPHLSVRGEIEVTDTTRLSYQQKNIWHPYKKLKNQIHLNKISNLKKWLVDFNYSTNILDKFSTEISGGERQILMLGDTIIGDNNICLLDEPTVGLDQQRIDIFINFINENQEKTFLISSHNRYFTERLQARKFSIQKETLVEINQLPKLPEFAFKNKREDTKSILKLENEQLSILSRAVFFRKKKFSLSIPFFELKNNLFLGISGDSGSGKTSFLRFLMGEYSINNPFSNMNYQYVDQNTTNSFDPDLTIQQSLRLLNCNEIEAQKAMTFLGIELVKINEYPHQFSGGELQRMALVRACSLLPEVLILDEPFQGMNEHWVLLFFEYVSTFNVRKKMAVVIVLHEIDWLRQICDEHYKIIDGQLLKLVD